MILGVMSDTHRNRAMMHAAADCMTAQLGASVLFHLGDDYADGAELAMSGHDVRYVPGLWCPEYHNPRIPRRIFETFDGVSVSCAHADRDLRAQELRASIILIGHTHAAAIEPLGMSVQVNPGHLKGPSSRGERPSFATITIDPESVTIRIHELLGEVRQEMTILRANLAD